MSGLVELIVGWPWPHNDKLILIWAKLESNLDTVEARNGLLQPAAGNMLSNSRKSWHLHSEAVAQCCTSQCEFVCGNGRDAGAAVVARLLKVIRFKNPDVVAFSSTNTTSAVNTCWIVL